LAAQRREVLLIQMYRPIVVFGLKVGILLVPSLADAGLGLVLRLQKFRKAIVHQVGTGMCNHGMSKRGGTMTEFGVDKARR
jgi:hypothetical protein